jgi:hypothetical protein
VTTVGELMDWLSQHSPSTPVQVPDIHSYDSFYGDYDYRVVDYVHTAIDDHSGEPVVRIY